ncbi:MAG TPA: sulfatase-like hydrolase/transferase, partial [Magnetospirillaceae bacterium]|nr:sulfatase-like hydrolase/transferase [Magnetospirillaceae bacterium]
SGKRDVAIMAHEAGRWIREQGSTPFFVTIGFSDPHRAPVNFGNTQEWPEVPTVRYSPSEVAIPSHLPDLPGVREDLAEYYTSVSRLDAGVGLLLDELAASGHEKDTLVIYLSDNGRPFPGAKDALYTEGIHLPLILRVPGQAKKGVRCRAMASWIDVGPTMLDWAGVSPPADYRYALPGRSLLPIVSQSDPAGWDRIFATHSFHEINQYYPVRAIRTRRYSYYLNLEPRLDFAISGDMEVSPSWKAIASTPGAKLGKRSVKSFLHRPAEEFYDLEKDPLELTNLVGHSAHAAALADLKRQLDSWRSATHDPWQKGVTDPFGHAH